MIKSYDKILNEGFDTLMKRSLVESCVNNKKNRRGKNKSLNESFQSNLNHEIYDAIGDVCWEFFSKDHEPTREELEQAISYFFEKWFEDNDLEE